MEEQIEITPPPASPRPDAVRGLFCNRTLNLRSLKAIGYDMDYTLIHYHVDEWEERAYAYIKERLVRDGWPVEDVQYRHDLVMRGLVLDLALGNVVKANRFGYVKKAFHGTRELDFDAQREAYSRDYVDLKESRWVFLNTFFSISEGCMYMQLVDLFDRGVIGEKGGPAEKMNYADLYYVVRRALDNAHAEGRLKGEIMQAPERFVDIDPDVPLALLDQKNAGKDLLLITNSEWSYTAAMLATCIDPFLPGDMTWRELFDISIVTARKPSFFTERGPAFEVVSDDGLLREHYGLLERGKVYVGGHAALVEASLGLKGSDILYIGDHLFTDVNISKNLHRWRTGLVLRELEDEVDAMNDFYAAQERLTDLMHEKVARERAFSTLRLALQRARMNYGPSSTMTAEEIEEEMSGIREKLSVLDAEIAPLAQQSAAMLNSHWGMLTRTGSDKSLLARQLENYADVYMARVGDFLKATPFAYLRSHRGSLPHDSL
jgi:5'-nucleotidase